MPVIRFHSTRGCEQRSLDPVSSLQKKHLVLKFFIPGVEKRVFVDQGWSISQSFQSTLVNKATSLPHPRPMQREPCMEQDPDLDEYHPIQINILLTIVNKHHPGGRSPRSADHQGTLRTGGPLHCGTFDGVHRPVSFEKCYQSQGTIRTECFLDCVTFYSKCPHLGSISRMPHL